MGEDSSPVMTLRSGCKKVNTSLSATKGFASTVNTEVQKETRGGSDGRILAAWRCDMQAAWRAHIRDNAPPFPYSDKLAQAAGIGLSKPHPAVPWRGSTRDRESARRRGFVMPKHGAFHIPLLKRLLQNVWSKNNAVLVQCFLSYIVYLNVLKVLSNGTGGGVWVVLIDRPLNTLHFRRF